MLKDAITKSQEHEYISSCSETQNSSCSSEKSIIESKVAQNNTAECNYITVIDNSCLYLPQVNSSCTI